MSATFLTEVRDDYGYIEEAYDEYSDNFVDDVYSEDPDFLLLLMLETETLCGGFPTTSQTIFTSMW